MSHPYEKYEGYLPGNDNPRWGQSYYFNFYDPQTRLGALVRIGYLENLGETNTWFIVFQDGMPLFTRTNMNLPYTQARPLGGVSIAGMHIEVVEPLKRIRISQTATDFSAELFWEAAQPLEDSIAMTTHDETSFSKEIAHVHLEGPCRVTGHVVHRGVRVDVDTGFGFRDMSAGPRNWDALRHYRLSWPVFANGMTFAGIHGISTAGQSAYMRMCHDGKRWLRVKQIEDQHEWAADRMSVNSLHWRIVDELDRSHEYAATPLFRWSFPFDTFVLVEQMMEYRLSDGTPGYGLFETGYRLPWAGPVD